MCPLEEEINPEDQRRAESRRDQHPDPSIGHTPDKAEGDEKTVDEALRNQDKRR